jgi:uncharacterized protein YbaR (Trm112 family)
MNADWLDLIACPLCRHNLLFVNGQDSALVCQGCGCRYEFQDQIPVLVPSEDLAGLTEFNRRYREIRLGEGWRSIPAEQALKLPFTRPVGFPGIYWKVRQQSFTALIDILSEHGPFPPMGPVVELGAGNGWLSYNLSRSGYQVVAIDSNVDETFGLGAAKIYLTRADFTLVQGDLNRPPLQDSKFSLVIFNASLHYARSLAAVLKRAGKALLPEGRILILDSPIAKKPRPTRIIGDRLLGRQELQNDLIGAGMQAQWLPVRRGARWWIEQGLRLGSGKPLFSLPVIAAKMV